MTIPEDHPVRLDFDSPIPEYSWEQISRQDDVAGAETSGSDEDDGRTVRRGVTSGWSTAVDSSRVSKYNRDSSLTDRLVDTPRYPGFSSNAASSSTQVPQLQPSSQSMMPDPSVVPTPLMSNPMMLPMTTPMLAPMMPMQNPLMNPMMFPQQFPQVARPAATSVQAMAASQTQFLRDFLRGVGVPDRELQGSFAELMGIARSRMTGNR